MQFIKMYPGFTHFVHVDFIINFSVDFMKILCIFCACFMQNYAIFMHHPQAGTSIFKLDSTRSGFKLSGDCNPRLCGIYCIQFASLARARTGSDSELPCQWQ
jgi:hypothetical protein